MFPLNRIAKLFRRVEGNKEEAPNFSQIMESNRLKHGYYGEEEVERKCSSAAKIAEVSRPFDSDSQCLTLMGVNGNLARSGRDTPQKQRY